MEEGKLLSKKSEWEHPGGKLRDLGPDALTETELLAIIISSGIRGKSAEKIANEILEKFGGFKAMANQPLKKFLKIKRLADVKIIRIAAAFVIISISVFRCKVLTPLNPADVLLTGQAFDRFAQWEKLFIELDGGKGKSLVG